MEQTIVGLVPDLETAQSTHNRLVQAGVDPDRINVLTHDEDGRITGAPGQHEHNEAVTNRGLEGAVGGAAIGGIGGLIFSLTALAVPGVGPLVAAGPIVAMMTGAGLGTMGGGIIGIITGLGVEEDEAEYYAKGLRKGGVLVSATVPVDLSTPVRRIMEENALVDVQEHTEEWNRQTPGTKPSSGK